MLEKALSGTRGYWAWLAFLVLVISVGVACWYWQYNAGLTITGLSRDVVWGFYIAQFTFLVGVAASAVMVVLPYYLHNYKAFGKITILGEFLAIAAVIMCMLFIFVDMGQPDRILNVFLHPTPNSMMFWDMVALFGLPDAEPRHRPRHVGRRAAGGAAAAVDQAHHHPLHPVGRQHPHGHRVPVLRAWPPGPSG